MIMLTATKREDSDNNRKQNIKANNVFIYHRDN